jgi:hypothetical protein
MCLTNISNKKIAETDIKCYKVVRKRNNKFSSLYQYAKVNLNKTYYSDIITIDNKIEIGLHSFKTLNDVKKLFHLRGLTDIYCVIECIIPKDAEYYEGNFIIYKFGTPIEYNLNSIASNLNSIASNAITYKKNITKSFNLELNNYIFDSKNF